MPENIEQPFIRNERGIVINLYGFTVISKIVVSWIFLGSSGIAYARSDYSFDAPKLGVRSPKSAQSKGGGCKADRERILFG